MLKLIDLAGEFCNSGSFKLCEVSLSWTLRRDSLERVACSFVRVGETEIWKEGLTRNFIIGFLQGWTRSICGCSCLSPQSVSLGTKRAIDSTKTNSIQYKTPGSFALKMKKKKKKEEEEEQAGEGEDNKVVKAP